MRRLVARTMAKQVAKKAEEATAPFQCFDHESRMRVRPPHLANHHRFGQPCNVVSIDGVGVCDLISSNDGGGCSGWSKESDPPFCAVLRRKPVNVSVGG